MSRLTPTERTLAARAAAYALWAQTEDRSAATAPARAGWVARFERQVDPENKLDPRERAIRADFAQRAHMASMGRKAAESRRIKAELKAAGRKARAA